LAQTDTSSVTWIFDRVDTIGGYVSTPLNELPVIIETSQGKAAYFDGINDGILLHCNPIGTATKFTLEVVFKPDSSDLTGDKGQPRFIHICDSVNNNNRRVTMETRILQDQRWILDTYIKASISMFLTQIDSTKTHTSGEWHHAAIVYSEGVMKQYVDGAEQISGSVTYQPIDSASGKISIGARQDPRYWFKGAIRMIKVSKRALTPTEFSLPTITKVQDVGEYPIINHLLQNYPNPFNPNTNITFIIKKESLVTLKVYNVLGREITTLVNEIKSAGTYAATWNALAFNSGVYFCKMRAGVFSSTLKMVLTK
jgi:hypothetical protein